MTQDNSLYQMNRESPVLSQKLHQSIVNLFDIIYQSLAVVTVKQHCLVSDFAGCMFQSLVLLNKAPITAHRVCLSQLRFTELYFLMLARRVNALQVENHIRATLVPTYFTPIKICAYLILMHLACTKIKGSTFACKYEQVKKKI